MYVPYVYVYVYVYVYISIAVLEAFHTPVRHERGWARRGGDERGRRVGKEGRARREKERRRAKG